MKKFIALAVLASSTAAFGAESSIYDIQYLPSSGTTYGFTTYESAKVTIEADSYEDEISGYRLSQTLGHAFTDRLSLEASLNYTDLEYEPDQGDKYDYAKGISDPTVSARFRTVDESFRWDIIGGATISIMDKETDVDSAGNIDGYDNLQGGHSLFAGTQFGMKSENMQWAILGRLTHYMKAENEFKIPSSLGGSQTFENDANNELHVRGDILNKLAEKSYLRSHLSVNFTEEVENDSDGVIATPAPATTYEIGTEYQHLFSQDLLASAGVAYQTQNQYTGSIDDITAWFFSVGANYQF